jgi:outer membrane lipoprotein-sorting protein
MTRALVAALALASVSCAGPLVKLPSGPGTPAPDAADALAEATSACRAVSTFSAEAAVSGSVGGRRLRGNLFVGVAPPASARIEAVAPAGQPIFIFVATGNDATLFLPRDGRVLRNGRPAAVLEAVAGAPLDAVELRETLTGCVLSASGAQGRQLGPDWRLVSVGQTDVYLRRNAAAARWQIAAAIHHPSTLRHAQGRPEQGRGTTGSGQVSGAGEWRVEYADLDAGVPRSIRLASADGKRFDLRLKLSQVEMNARLGPEVFRVQIPPDAEPITLEELRRSGPLGSSSADSTQGTRRTLRIEK